jgi:hypothetical protein
VGHKALGGFVRLDVQTRDLSMAEDMVAADHEMPDILPGQRGAIGSDDV